MTPLGSPGVMTAVFIVLALAASIQSILITLHPPKGTETEYTFYNNYNIFKHSFHHVVEGKDPYVYYPEEHHDLYKYSPSFAIFFGFFASLPDWLGLSLWNLLNAMALVIAIYYLPSLNRSQKALILLLCAVDMLTNVQSDQSNGLIAGLLILGFGLLEKKRWSLAMLCIISTAFIKLFGIGACLLLLFYPGKWKPMLYTLLWIAVIAAVPLLVMHWEQYRFLLSGWIKLLSSDHAASHGYSVMGLMSTWFSLSAKFVVVAIGLMVLLLPLIRVRMYQVLQFRMLALASILVWVVIFNHKAESSTFIIAMAGASLWLVSSPRNAVNLVLFALAVFLVTLSPSDLFPKALRQQVVEPYLLRALPYLLIWLKIIYDMLTMPVVNSEANTFHSKVPGLVGRR